MKLVYPGSFDPVTKGHFDLIIRASRLASELIVAVGIHGKKKPLFTVEERVGFLDLLIERYDLDNVDVRPFMGLAVDVVIEQGADAIVSGLRNPSDFEYELAMSMTNRTLREAEVETIFMTSGQEYCFTSSSLIKEAASGGASLERYLEPEVEEALKKRL